MAKRSSRRRLRPLARLFRWTLWLALLAALAVQLRILADGGFRLPAFAQDQIVRRLAAEGLAFDAEAIWVAPNGRLMFVRPRLGLNGQDSPVASARAVAVHLRRRELFAGRLRATELEIADLSLNLPAIVSPTGAAQPLLEAGEFRLSCPPGADHWTVDQASARLLSIPAAFTGTLPAVTPSAFAPASRLPAAETTRDILRKVADTYRHLAALPLDRIRVLRVDLSPSRLVLSTELPSLSLSDYPLLPAGFPDVGLEEVQATLELPLARPTNDLGELSIRARRLKAPAPWLLEGEDVSLRIAARGQTLRLGQNDDKTIALDLAAARFRKTDLPLPAIPLVAQARFAATGGMLDVELSARLADAPWGARFSGAVGDRAGSVAAQGELTPALLDQVRYFLPAKARPILELTDPVRLDLSALVAPGAEPVRVVARASAGRAVAGHVRFDRAGAVLLYEPSARLFRADDLMLVQDDSSAFGSYEMDTETLAFRFLLGGRFRPASISGWFSGWWDRFWTSFRFGPVAPDANVDIRGVWRDPDRTTVFVGAASGAMRLRDLELDSLRTRIQVAVDSFDILGFHATRGDHVADGRFARLLGHDHDTWSYMNFDVRSDFPIEALPRLFPEEGPALAAPFALTSAPSIHLAGETFGPASDTPGRQRYDLAIAADAPLRYSGFPLDRLSLRLERRDADLHLRDIRAGFASGRATGEATLSGPDADRWLAFDLTLADADLDLAQTRWKEFQATRPAPAPSASSPSDKKKSEAAASKDAKESKPLGGRISAHLAATGPLENPLAYSGRGEARIAGAELANIRLMGPLSSLLGEIGIGFTTLKLTEADARLALDRNRLVFEDLRLTGPTALVEAKGVYTLPEGLLDFKAKVRPFDQGGGVLSSTVNFVTSPLSSVLEVELTGPLENPAWSFSYGPTKLLRRLF